jgi:hypothetical protein
MKNIDYIRDIIRYILREETNLNIRTGKGMGAGHPFVDRKSLDLGSTIIDKLDVEEGANRKKPAERKFRKVKVSKAFINNY